MCFQVKEKRFDFVFNFPTLSHNISYTIDILFFNESFSSYFMGSRSLARNFNDLGILKKKFNIKIFRIFVNWIYRRSDIILSSIKSFVENIKKFVPDKKNIYYYLLGAKLTYFSKNIKPTDEIKPSEKFTILFAGNIGEAQDFKSVNKSCKVVKLQKYKKFQDNLIRRGSKKMACKSNKESRNRIIFRNKTKISIRRNAILFLSC